MHLNWRSWAGLCQAAVQHLGAPFRVILSTDAREALTGASHIITSIRPGFEQGRAIDERIAFKHGALGQETTGAAGFAMAMRSLPAILDYCRLAEQVAPGAWVYNFTNPAGLWLRALHGRRASAWSGFADSANGAPKCRQPLPWVISRAQIRHEDVRP